jgi:tRNA G46 methylase TrmB
MLIGGKAAARPTNLFTAAGHIDIDMVLGQQGAQTKLELCSGHGEWVVAQAKSDPSSRWIAVELRHDRVVSTVTHMHLDNVNNLAVVGGDASVVLRNHVVPDSIDRIFVNHPEPPERSGESSQGSHLLTPDFFDSMRMILREAGTLTIVTDNLPYAVALAETAASTGFQTAKFLSRSHNQEVKQNVGDVSVFVGCCGSEVAHSASASSFFDRMWLNGKKVKRYTLFLSIRGA